MSKVGNYGLIILTGIIGGRDEEIEVGIDIEVSGEEIIEMGRDVGLVWSLDEVERIGEVEWEIELGTSISTEGVLVVSIRIQDKLILEK